MAKPKTPLCSKTHSSLSPEALRCLESAFAKVRRWTAQRRLAGGTPVSDEEVAAFIDEAMDSIVPVASAIAQRRERERANESARDTKREMKT